MKIPRIQPVRHSLVRAFTLIELLVVISIIALLAALSMGTFNMATQASSRNRTIATQQAIINGLNRYKEANGEYPAPLSTAGHSFTTTAGAQMLYQAITGDGYDQISMASAPNPAPNHSSSNGSVDPNFPNLAINSEFVPTKSTSGASTTWKSKLNSTMVDTTNRFYLMDGFGHPFQYEKAVVTSVSQTVAPNPTTVNPDYDLWSYGTSTNTADPTGNTLSERTGTGSSGSTVATWIKNW